MRIWKNIPGHEKYQASNLGEIRSTSYRGGKKIKILKLQQHLGYPVLKVMVDGIEKCRKVHRLVALAFIPNPNNYPVVMHLDNNPSNNRVENLRWGTYKDNTQQCWRDNRSNNNLKYRNPNIGRKGILHKDSKKVLQYDLEGNFIKEWDSTMDIERELGVWNSGVSACALGKFKTAKGYIWKYKESVTQKKHD